ncbi:SH3 domain-containing protein [bacterium]|nr:SH3 domain-containing protein [bacterium]
MRKNILGMVVSILFVPVYAHATADGPDCWEVKGVADNDVLNIREGAGISYKIVGTIPPHAKGVANSNNLECPDDPASPKPKECGSGWCRVTYNKITGWVNCKYLKGSGDCQ